MNLRRNRSADLKRLLCETPFFLIRGTPAFCILSLASLAYLTIGVATFFHDYLNVPAAAETFLVNDRTRELSTSLKLLFICFFFAHGILMYVLKRDFYTAPQCEKFFALRLIRFHRKRLEDCLAYNSLYKIAYVATVFNLMFWLLINKDGDFVFSDPRLVVQPGLIFNCLFVYPYAFIHSTWAFPLMACYLNWTLEQIAENGAGRLGDYLSGREYRSRQLENEESN